MSKNDTGPMGVESVAADEGGFKSLSRVGLGEEDA